MPESEGGGVGPSWSHLAGWGDLLVPVPSTEPSGIGLDEGWPVTLRTPGSAYRPSPSGGRPGVTCHQIWRAGVLLACGSPVAAGLGAVHLCHLKWRISGTG